MEETGNNNMLKCTRKTSLSIFKATMQKRAILFPNLVLAKLILPCLRKHVNKEKLLVIATKHQKQSPIYTKVNTFLVIFLAISVAIFLTISLLFSQLIFFRPKPAI